MKYWMMRRGSLTINAICKTLRLISSSDIARHETRIGQAESLKCKYFAFIILRPNTKQSKYVSYCYPTAFPETTPPPPKWRPIISWQGLFESAFIHFHIFCYQLSCRVVLQLFWRHDNRNCLVGGGATFDSALDIDADDLWNNSSDIWPRSL